MSSLQVQKKRNPPRIRCEPVISSASAKKNVKHEDPAESPLAKEVCLQRVEIEHTYQLTTSPRKLKMQLDRTREQLTRLKRKLKTSQQKCRRLTLRVQSLKSVRQCFKKKQLITLSSEQMLNQTIYDVPLALVKGIKYSPYIEISDHSQLLNGNSKENA